MRSRRLFQKRVSVRPSVSPSAAAAAAVAAAFLGTTPSCFFCRLENHIFWFVLANTGKQLNY